MSFSAYVAENTSLKEHHVAL